MTKQKNRSSEQQLRSVTQAVEAVALGTMAGGLALGAVQAREAQPLPDDAQGVVAPVAIEPDTESAPQAQPLEETTAVVPDRTIEERGGQTESTVPDLIVTQDHQTQPQPEVRIEVGKRGEIPTTETDAPIAQQISVSIERLVADAAEVGLADASALPLAGKILESVADIVSALRPGIDTSPLKSLGDTIQAQVDAALQPASQVLDDLPGAIQETVESALNGAGLDALSGELAMLPSSVADVTSSAARIVGDIGLPSLPSSLLGNDGPAVDEGLLSSIFYSDGEADTFAPPPALGHSADSLLIPDMMQAGFGDVGGIADQGLGLLALSYADLSPDGMHPASGGVGGLGLL